MFYFTKATSSFCICSSVRLVKNVFNLLKLFNEFFSISTIQIFESVYTNISSISYIWRNTFSISSPILNVFYFMENLITCYIFVTECQLDKSDHPLELLQRWGSGRLVLRYTVLRSNGEYTKRTIVLIKITKVELCNEKKTKL